MVLTPNMGDYWSLQTLANSGTSFDGADQGLFNQYFGNRPWHRLSFAYNCTPSANYQYEPAYRHFRSSITLAHFIGKRKPWQQGRREMNRPESGVYRELLGTWWSVYDRHYKAKVCMHSWKHSASRSNIPSKHLLSGKCPLRTSISNNSWWTKIRTVLLPGQRWVKSQQAYLLMQDQRHRH